MKIIVAQFIPIFLIIALLSYSKEFVNMSYTILGKVIAICIIIFYTHLDKYVGLVLCLCVIIYYQSDYVENMLNTDEIMEKLYEKFEDSTKKQLNESKPNVNQIQSGAVKTSQLQENMSSLTDVYPDNKKEIDDSVENDEPEKAVEGMTTINAFRKENCKDKQLMNKNSKVNPDMTKLIFPNVEFNNGQCNICDEACEFSIVENRLKTEKELFSKFSRDISYDTDKDKNVKDKNVKDKKVKEPLCKHCK